MEGLSKEKGGNIYSRIRSSFVPIIISALKSKRDKTFYLQRLIRFHVGFYDLVRKIRELYLSTLVTFNLA